jgi:hypothetical protein
MNCPRSFRAKLPCYSKRPTTTIGLDTAAGFWEILAEILGPNAMRLTALLLPETILRTDAG